MVVSELIAKYSTHQIYLERIAAGLGAEGESIISALNDGIVSYLSKESKKPSFAGNQRKIKAKIAQMVDDALKAVVDAIKKDASELIASELAFQNSALSSVLLSEVSTGVPAISTVAALVKDVPVSLGSGFISTYRAIFERFERDQADRIKAVIDNGFIYGKTNNEISDLIFTELNQLSPKAQTQARMLARTATNHVATQARLAFGAGNADIIDAWRSVGTLDSRTSRECASLDGVIMKENDPRWAKFVTPRHPNCRSTLVPVVRADLVADNESAERPSKLTPNGKTKRVSSKDRYYDVLSKMSTTQQDEILGSTLGRAFRKLDDPEAFARMTIDTKTLSPLTIEQMMKKDTKLARILKDMRAQ